MLGPPFACLGCCSDVLIHRPSTIDTELNHQLYLIRLSLIILFRYEPSDVAFIELCEVDGTNIDEVILLYLLIAKDSYACGTFLVSVLLILIKILIL